jgi:hypothetical protein
MIGILEVKVVGGGSSSVLGIPEGILIAGAAILAAGIAAAVAVWRMRTELAHDRAMRNRDNSRATLDEAMETANQALQSVTICEGSIEVLQDAMKDAGRTGEVPELRGECQVEFNKANDSISQLALQGIRLRFRLEDEVLPDAYQQVVDDYRGHRNLLRPGIYSALSDEQREAITEADEKCTSSMAALMSACGKWLHGA